MIQPCPDRLMPWFESYDPVECPECGEVCYDEEQEWCEDCGEVKA